MTEPRGNGTELSPPALELIDVVKEYPGSPSVRALDGVTLRVDAGELLAIVGPSGSGKSTMLQVMGTLDRPTSGVVKIDGIEVSQLSDRKLSAARSRMIGFVFQQFFLLDGATAVENVANGLLYSGTPKRRRLHRAAVALDRVGLRHRLHHNPNELSGGERQRVAIARALVHDPAIVLADEPTGNLDSTSSESVVQLLRDLHRDGRTIVVITHDRDLAASLPRQVGVRDGQLDAHASTSLAGATT
jgi:putative ABC transport system ATP-binding protein